MVHFVTKVNTAIQYHKNNLQDAEELTVQINIVIH